MIMVRMNELIRYPGVDISEITKIRDDNKISKNKVYVNVGKEVNESVLCWALRNSSGALIGVIFTWNNLNLCSLVIFKVLGILENRWLKGALRSELGMLEGTLKTRPINQVPRICSMKNGTPMEMEGMETQRPGSIYVEAQGE
ncbi:hypothetical protein Tco_0550449 [Tanacetum coccineum]